MKFTLEQINERKRSVPDDIKLAISSTETSNKIENISNKNNLHIDQMGILSSHIAYLMLGLLNPKDFIEEISRSMKVDYSVSKKIAIEVNEQIFRPIRESLKKIHQLNEGGGGSIMENGLSSTSSTPLTKSPNFDDRLNKYLSTTPSESRNPLPTPVYTQDPYREPTN